MIEYHIYNIFDIACHGGIYLENIAFEIKFRYMHNRQFERPHLFTIFSFRSSILVNLTGVKASVSDFRVVAYSL